MILIPHSIPISQYATQLGSSFSLWEKVKMGGTGSAKVVYVKGIDRFEPLTQVGQALDYINFELFLKGILIRFFKQNKTERVIIEKGEINRISFISRRIEVTIRGYHQYIESKRGLVHDATINFLLKDGRELLFYTPTSFYKVVHRYFRKNWLFTKTSFKVDPAPPLIDKEGAIAAAILGL